MALTANWYGKALTAAFNKEIDIDEAGKVKVMLCTSTYTPDQDAHDYKNDVTNEITGTGYTAGGQALTNVAVSYGAGTNTWKFTADNSTWVASTLTARYGVVYYDTGTAATSPLICYVNFGSDQSSTANNFTIVWDTAGIGKVVVS